VFPKELPLDSNYYLLLSFAILLNTQNIFCLLTLIKIARSISSATDSKLSPSDIDSIHGQCAAGIIKLNTDETQFKRLRVVLIKQNVGTRVL
jgi:hypothetical protein